MTDAPRPHRRLEPVLDHTPAAEPAFGPNGRGETQPRASGRGETRARRGLEGVDRRIATLAEAQHGVVARRQLLDRGLSRRAVEHRLARGRLHLVHRGVYAVGHRLLTKEGRWIAAVLAAGEGAVLSHSSAAALWGLEPARPARAGLGAGGVVVTVPAKRRPRPGIVQRQGRLEPADVARADGIPVTSVPRTLVDLATTVDGRRLARAMHEAEVRRLVDARSLLGELERHGGRRGVGMVRRLVEINALGAETTRSELERRFLELLADADVERPRANARIRAGGGEIEVDFLWPRPRLIAELDGHATHVTRAKFERDRERDRRLSAAGWRVVRITWRQLHDAPSEVLRDLTSMLGL